MPLVVFLRGVNVGGHKTFRPSAFAGELGDYDVVNVGAAGTFVVRGPVTRAKLRTELLRRLPFEAEIALCEGRDVVRLALQNPFPAEPSRPGIVRFVSVLTKACRVHPCLPVSLPSKRGWLVRIFGLEGQFVFGMYRRHMKTIGCLGQIDELVGVPVTTRNWNTMLAVARVLDRHAGRTGRWESRRFSQNAQGARNAVNPRVGPEGGLPPALLQVRAMDGRQRSDPPRRRVTPSIAAPIGSKTRMFERSDARLRTHP